MSQCVVGAPPRWLAAFRIAIRPRNDSLSVISSYVCKFSSLAYDYENMDL
jgi:hypothetical protein